MTEGPFTRYPDRATDALLARAEAAIKRSARVAVVLGDASRILAEGLLVCHGDLARIPATTTTACRPLGGRAR